MIARLRTLREWMLVALVLSAASGLSTPLYAAGEEESPGKAEPGPAVPGPVFVKLPLFNIPVIEGDKVTRQVTVGVAFELVEGVKAESVDEKKPALIDAFFRDLYSMFGQRSGISRVAVEASIKQRLGQSADRVLGPGIVRQVLILELLERPL